MVKVLALGGGEGGDILRLARPQLERLLPLEQVAPLPERDTSDIADMDMRVPFDHAIDPV
jgi:hypothetical protein